MNVINIKNLIFNYGQNKILDIKSFEIKEKEKIFLYGPSGSGKSTLLNLIQGVLTTKSGTLEVLGTNLAQLPASKRDHFRGENLGCIFQNFNLINFLTVRENILLPLDWNTKVPSIKFDDLVQKLGLQSILAQRADEISVGQAQRVAIARAIYANPKMIIADEPTSALDQEQKNEFIKLLLENAQDQTIIFVSHDLSLKSLFTRSVALKEINQ